MPKAKTINRLEYTKSRSVHLQDTPIRNVEGYYDEEQGAIVAQEKTDVEVCPVCGAELIHEAGCMRCLCGWSRC